ncbi:MAG: DUF4367 domain-containing protein [Clostridia bacterium]|nr:DUF4367 domain-containing protein [Clostridia bacterium]
MLNDKDTEIKSRYEDYSVEELKEAYQTIFLYSSEYSDDDLAEMDEILAILKKKNPVPRKYTTEESWALFQETYSEELSRLGVQNAEEVIQKNPPADAEEVPPISIVKSISEDHTPRPVRPRKLLRVAVVAAAIVVILVAAAATASALGYDIFGWVPKWNNDVLSFGEDESPEPNELHDSPHVAVVLKDLGIDEPIYPSWLPDGFRIDVSVIETDPIFIHEGYSDGERYLTITIEPLSQTGIISFQKDEQNPTEYIANNRSYFIFADNSCYTATWQTENYSVYIMGEITLDEMKRIIDSVNEVKK